MNDLFEPNGPLFPEQKKNKVTLTFSAPLPSMDLSVREMRKGQFSKRLKMLLENKQWNQSELARASNLG